MKLGEPIEAIFRFFFCQILWFHNWSKLKPISGYKYYGERTCKWCGLKEVK